MMATWRPIRGSDLFAVERIANEVWPPQYYETPCTFAARINMGGGFCHVLEDERRIVGYLIAHPWDNTIPSLNRKLGLPMGFATLFLHDLAILPDYRGQGLGEQIVETIKPQAANALRTITLVAVEGSVPFWNRRGFLAVDAVDGLESYGPTAVRMQWSGR